MVAPILPVCPTCKQIDQVQKVTSTYGVNTKEWYETGTRTDADGNSRSYQEKHEAHTQLGLKLKPPQGPAQPTHPGLWYGIGGLVAFVLISALCPIAFIPLSFLIPLAGTASAVVPDIQGIPSWRFSLGVIGLPTLSVFGVALAFFIWLGSKVRQRFNRDMANYRDKKAVYDRDELPHWQRARERWEQLNYCMRDETVFIPAENKAVAAADMLKYLYDPYFRG